MTTPAGIYPFATQDGKAIPLDIIKPSGLIVKAFTATPSSFVIPAGYAVGVFFSTTASLVRFGSTLPNPLVDATLYEDTLLVPMDTSVIAAITPGTVYVKSISGEGALYLQLIEKWAGLALSKQYSAK